MKIDFKQMPLTHLINLSMLDFMTVNQLGDFSVLALLPKFTEPLT